MSRFSCTIAVLLLASLVLGCGGSQDTSVGTEGQSAPGVGTQESGQGFPVADSGQPGVVSAPNAKLPPPGDITAQFYEALRGGNRDAIGMLLTDKARQETAKNGLDIRSQASTSLTYAIGETDYVTEEMDGAHVASLWTETDEQGQSMTSPVIWVLRKQTNGWRIAGMATPVVEGELPLFFDFEDPENMMRTKEYVENEVYGGQEEQAKMAQQTSSPNESTPTGTEIR